MYSVVIPTYNRSDSLLRTLNSVVNQTLSPDQYEIIVIDDGSTDDTESNVKCPEIRYFKIKHGGSAAARNFGIKRARGEIIFFTDDDCIVPPDWMEKILDGYRRYPDVVGVGGYFKPPENEERFFQKTAYLINFLSDSFGGEKIIDSPFAPAAFAANVSYKKNILEKVGGFDENISALASVELRYRIIAKQKEKILCVPVFVTHNCDLNFWGYIKKIFNQGRCKQYCNAKYFSGKPPLAFDVTFRRAPRKLFMIFSNVLTAKKAKKSDLPAIFVFLAFEVFFNALGGFVENNFGRLSGL